MQILANFWHISKTTHNKILLSLKFVIGTTRNKSLRHSENFKIKKMVSGVWFLPTALGVHNNCHFYKTCLEWPFHSTNRHKNCLTRLCELPHIYQKFSKARFVKVHLGHLECEFRQNFKRLLKIQFQASNYFMPYQKYLPPDFVKILKLKKSILGVFPNEVLKVTKNGHFL